MTPTLSWSEWRPLERSSVRDLGQCPGVYQISCQATSCLVYVGSATGRAGLRQRLSQRVDDPQRYLSTYEKRLRKQGCCLMFRYSEAGSAAQAKDWEAVEIDEYRKLHGHLPPGNKVTPHKASAAGNPEHGGGGRY